MASMIPSLRASAEPAVGPAALVWATGAAAMVALDGRVDLASLAMLMVLTAAVAAVWLPAWAALAGSALGVLAFNWTFIPPRGSFAVDLRQHALLLGTMLAVSAIVTLLMAALRRQAAHAARQAARAEQLRAWADALRDTDDPSTQAGALQAALAAMTGAVVTVQVLKDRLPPSDDDAALLAVGTADADRRAGLWHCLRDGRPMGPDTGRHEEQPDWYLPLRGRGAVFGAAVICEPGRQDGADLHQQSQALCDALGMALQRAQAARDERRAREEAQTQAVRGTLLAAISHDYRTPLAAIMGAASSLDEQGERLDAAQRRRLARSIVDEAAGLARLTDNALQLARLDAPGVTLRRDWESAEEIAGTVLRRARRHDPSRRVRARLEPPLPLLWCDALLLTQLLDNLVDNALKYSPAEAPVELLVRSLGDQVLLAVRDRGPGIAPAWREQVFRLFQRGGADGLAPGLPAARPGAGVGLAVCRAIARAHGGELRLRPRGHGGCSFECWLPAPAPPPEPDAP